MTDEPTIDMLRNSKDLYGSIHHVIAALAAYDFAKAAVDPMIALHLARVSSKILPHLPKPAEDANVW